MDEMDANDVRQMVLGQCAHMAHRLVPVVREHGLASGYVEEKLEVAGVTWDLTTWYWKATDMVRVQGFPIRDEQHGQHPFMLVFVVNPTDDGSFSYMVPASWLPTVDKLTEGSATMTATTSTPEGR